MSAYIPRFCEKHGEWDQDVDNPYEECEECVKDGAAPSQKAAAHLAELERALSAATERAEAAEADARELWEHLNDRLKQATVRTYNLQNAVNALEKHRAKYGRNDGN